MNKMFTKIKSLGYKYIESNGCYSKVIPETNEKKENDFWEVKLKKGICTTESAIDVKKKRK